MGDVRNIYKILVGRPEGKRPPEWSRRKSEDHISVEGVDWIHLAQDRDQWRGLVKTTEKLWIQ